jgi:hypothetical protein
MSDNWILYTTSAQYYPTHSCSATPPCNCFELYIFWCMKPNNVNLKSTSEGSTKWYKKSDNTNTRSTVLILATLPECRRMHRPTHKSTLTSCSV